MADQPKPARLELVRERPEPTHPIEHPHCDEHFLFTPHCAACVELHRTATTHVAAKTSRSFGFTGNIPYSLMHEPTLLEQVVRYELDPCRGDLVGHLIDDILKP